MKVHLLGLPHAHLSPDVTVCAFTTKAWKFLKMMGSRGWEIIYYGGENSDVRDYAELVPIYSDGDQKKWFGDMDANMLPIIAGSWHADSPQFAVTNARAVLEIERRYARGDIILISGGLAQKAITDALPPPNYLACEWAAGYSGTYLPYVCFESYAWRHYLYAKFIGTDVGRWYDTVIPNFFDPDEWTLHEKEDYLVFVGRLIARKGPQVAAAIARELGMPLLVAGSGMKEVTEGLIVCHDGTQIMGDVHYVGTVGRQQRDQLMGSARALICPTFYIEPFGAVCIEAPLCGTASVATDWGSFPELIPAERRFRTLQEGCEAVEHAMTLDPAELQQEALQRFSLEAVAPMYERWFDELSTLWGAGWYQMREPVSV